MSHRRKRATSKRIEEQERREEEAALRAANDEWNIGRAWKEARDLAFSRNYDGAVSKLRAARAGVTTAALVASIEELCRDMEQVRATVQGDRRGAPALALFLLALFEGNVAAAEKELPGLKLRAEYLDLLDRARMRSKN